MTKNTHAWKIMGSGCHDVSGFFSMRCFQKARILLVTMLDQNPGIPVDLLRSTLLDS